MRTLVDCGCETKVHADGSGVEIYYCPKHEAAPELYKAAATMLSALSDYFLDCGLDLLAERLRRKASVSTGTKTDVIEGMKRAADNLAEVMRKCK